MKLELIDWKDMEREAIKQIREGTIMQTIGNKILWEAEKQIKSLGGKTAKEEKAENKKLISENSTKE